MASDSVLILYYNQEVEKNCRQYGETLAKAIER
jgi:hypothetical protein